MELLVTSFVVGILGLTAGTAGACYALVVLKRIRRDLSDLSRVMKKETQAPGSRASRETVQLRTSEGHMLLRTWRLINDPVVTGRSLAPAYESAVSEGVRLLEKGFRPDEVVDGVAEVVLRAVQRRGEVLVLVRNRTGGWTSASRGMHAARLIEPVTMIADQVLSGHKSAGYSAAKAGEWDDFAAVGIGAYYTQAIGAAEEASGVIWVGLRGIDATLGTELEAYLSLLSKHAAASLKAAGTVEESALSGRAETEFLLGLSHDLRSPATTALYGLEELLQGAFGELTPGQAMVLGTSRDVLKNQLKMMADVLCVVRAQGSARVARREDVEVADLVQRAIKVSLGDAESALVNVSGVTSCRALVDPGHGSRILENLLRNARLHGEGKPISVWWESLPGVVRITVEDQGPGVPEDIQKSLFDAFVRGGSAERRSQGWGLGLAVCKTLAELNGGRIYYEPNPRGGARFVVSLDAGVAPALLSGERHSQSGSHSHAVLILEDDAATARMYRRYLEGVVAECVVASSLAGAREELGRKCFDIIVSDVWVGPENVLADLLAEPHGLPVVVVSGSGDPAVFASPYPPGLVVHEKPVEREQLRATVQALLAQRALH